VDIELTDQQRAEMFREFHADQLKKQTKHLDTISRMMILWLLLTILGELIYLIELAAG